MAQMNTPEAGASWVLNSSTASQTVSITLNTAGKYLDRNIQVTSTVNDAVINLSSEGDKTLNPQITAPELTDAEKAAGAIEATLVDTAPTDGTYMKFTVPSVSVTDNYSISVNTPGYISSSKNDTKEITVTTNVDTKYLSLAGATVTSTLNVGTLTDYFTTGTSTSYKVAISSGYINSAGYIAEHTTTQTDYTTYWNIADSSVSVTNSTGLAGLSGYTAISDMAVPSGGALVITKGWHATNEYITLAELIPDITDDAADSNMLSGYKAYDEDGNVLVGTIANLSSRINETYEKYLTTINTNAQTGLIGLPKGTYIDNDYYIKAGSVSASISYGTVTPTIVSSGSNVVTTTVTTVKPSSGFYVKASSQTTSVSYTVSTVVNNAGYVDSTHGANTTNDGNININASADTYIPIQTGVLSVTAPSALTTDTATNTISATAVKFVSDSVSTKYPIKATANVQMSTGALNCSVTTNGYVDSTIHASAGTNSISGTEQPEATAYIKPGSVSVTSSITVAPAVTISYEETDVEIANSTTNHKIVVSTGTTNGSVVPNYTAVEGYVDAVTKQTGDTLTVVPTVTNNVNTIYIKDATITASITPSTTAAKYFTTGTATTNDFSIVVDGTVSGDGYATSADNVSSTQYYNIVETSLIAQNNTGANIEKGTNSNTITASDVTLYANTTSHSGTYRAITASATINASVTATATVSVTSAGWVEPTSQNVTVSGESELGSTGTMYIEVYTGDYTIA